MYCDGLNGKGGSLGSLECAVPSLQTASAGLRGEALLEKVCD